MAVSDSYLTLVLEQLRRVHPGVRARRMFGGAGIYADHVIFGLVTGDALYLKTDAATRDAYEARGMAKFQPFGEGTSTMPYHQLPEDVLEDPETLRPWVEQAIAVSRRSREAVGPGKRRK